MLELFTSFICTVRCVFDLRIEIRPESQMPISKNCWHEDRLSANRTLHYVVTSFDLGKKQILFKPKCLPSFKKQLFQRSPKLSRQISNRNPIQKCSLVKPTHSFSEKGIVWDKKPPKRSISKKAKNISFLHNLPETEATSETRVLCACKWILSILELN